MYTQSVPNGYPNVSPMGFERSRDGAHLNHDLSQPQVMFDDDGAVAEVSRDWDSTSQTLRITLNHTDVGAVGFVVKA